MNALLPRLVSAGQAPQGGRHATLLRCLVLSMLLHALAVAIFGTATGDPAPRSGGWWGALDVTLSAQAPEQGRGLTQVPGAEPEPAPVVLSTPASHRPDVTERAVRPRSNDPPLTTPAPAPTPAQEAPTPAVAPATTPEALSPPVMVTTPVDSLALPEIEPLRPVPLLRETPREVPIDVAAPAASPVSAQAPAQVPMTPVTPAAPPNSVEPVQPALRMAPASPPPELAPSASPTIEPIAKPRLPDPPVATPTPLAQPAIAPAGSDPARNDRDKVADEAVSPKAEAMPRGGAPDKPESARPATRNDKSTGPPLARPGPIDEPITAGRSDAWPAAPASAVTLDADALRKRIRNLSQQSAPGVLKLLPPPPEHKAKITEEVEKSGKPDCRTAYSGMGLLAVAPLAVATVGEGGCRW